MSASSLRKPTFRGTHALTHKHRSEVLRSNFCKTYSATSTLEGLVSSDTL